MVALVDEDRAALEQVAVAFQDQVDDGVEQRMARTDESRQRLPGRGDQRLLEHDPFVAGEGWLAGPDHPVAVPDQGRNVRHLVAARFTLAGRAAELSERLMEERFDVVRLQAARLGPLHLLAHALYAAGVHRVVDELPLLEQVLQRRSVERLVDGSVEPRADLRLLAVADGVEQQLAQRPPFELQLAEHVEDLAAERLPGLFQLLEQPPVDVALAGLVGDQVPQVADLRLADAVDAAEALFQAVRIPGQVVVDHQVGALQVDAVAGGVGGQQHLHLRVVPERFLRRQTFLAAHAAVDDDHRRLSAEQCRDALLQVAQRVAVLGEDHQLLMRRGRGPRDRAVTVANGRLPGPAVPSCSREDLAEQARELAPLGIRASTAYAEGEALERLQCVEFHLQLHDGPGGGRLVEDARLGVFHLLLRRVDSLCASSHTTRSQPASGACSFCCTSSSRDSLSRRAMTRSVSRNQLRVRAASSLSLVRISNGSWNRR